MTLQTVTTFSEVMAVLGGNQGVGELTGAKPSTLSMWRKAEAFPSNTYVVITEALRAVGKTAPASLWGMKQCAEPEQAA